MTRPVVAVLTILLFAGCLTDVDDRNGDDGAGTAHPTPSVLGAYTIPPADGARAHDWLDTFVTTFPLRVTGTATEERAAEHITAALEQAGYRVEVMALGAHLPVVPDADLPAVPGAQLKAIVATIPGTTMPDHWLAWGGHYDSVPQTIEGAYDNGSGVTASLELARMLAQVDTARTKAVILFNGEEQGTLASEAFVQAYQSQSATTIDLFVGLDMVGIAYPAPHPLAFFSGAAYGPDFVDLARTVAIDELGLPGGNQSVTFSHRNTRNSDEASFASERIATMRFAGMKNARDYPGFHTHEDTMQTIHDTAGGPDNFEAGLANTMRFAAGMILALDVAGVPDPLGGSDGTLTSRAPGAAPPRPGPA